jgi:alkanesulfonate monooxygenase SsuD/methylene tetrahydromethanopterin reductase-like flavin-dependent oxidoreductase (luciferase family)
VAQYASEWNAVYIAAGKFRELNHQLDELLQQRGREPHTVRRSLMTRVEMGDAAALQPKFPHSSLEQLRQRGLILGTADEIVQQLGQLAEAGVQRVMLQWLDLDDLDGLETFAHTVLPQLA